MEHLEWKLRGTETTHVGRRTIVSKEFELPDGRIAHFDTKDDVGSRAVAVIGLTIAKKALVVKLYRPGPEKVMWEIPGGGVESGEELEAAARREFSEETGHSIGSMRYLGQCYYDAYTNTERHYFFAENCTPSGEGQKLDPEEQLDVAEISISQLMANALQGRMTDPGAVLMAYDELRALQ